MAKSACGPSARPPDSRLKAISCVCDVGVSIFIYILLVCVCVYVCVCVRECVVRRYMCGCACVYLTVCPCGYMY